MSPGSRGPRRAKARLSLGAFVALVTCGCNVLVGVTDITFADASAEGGDATTDGAHGTDAAGGDTGSMKADSSTKDAGSDSQG